MELKTSPSLTRRQWLVVFLGLGAVVFCISRALKGGADFDVFLQAGQKLVHHQDIYRPPFLNDLQYYNGPLFALLLAPFSFLPPFVPKFLWLIASTAMLYRTWRLFERYLDSKKLTPRSYAAWWVISVLLVSRFIGDNYNLVQLTIFILWATFEGLDLIGRKRAMAGSALLAVAINVKLLPLLFVPYLLYRREFKAFTYTCLFSILVLLIPALFLGFSYNTWLLKQWWSVIDPSNRVNMIEAGNGTHSLVALIPVFLTETTGKLAQKRNLVNLSYDQVCVVVNAARVVLAGLTLFFLHTLPLKKPPGKAHQFREIAYLCLVTPLLFPHQQKYAFLYMLPAICYAMFWLVRKEEGDCKRVTSLHYAMALVLFIAAMLLSAPIGADVIGPRLFDLVQHYRFLTFGALAIIPALALCNPDVLDGFPDPIT